MNNIIVKTTGLKKYYQLGKHRVKALDGVDFSVEEGEFVSIIGKSGSGKSTLLHLIGGLDTPTAGDVCVDNIHLAKMSREELAVFRRRNIGFIFQNYNLVPDLNVFENITLPVELDGGKPSPFCSWRIKRRRCREISPEGSSSALPLPGQLHQSPVLFWRTNLQEIWTPPPAMMLWDC